MANLTPADLWDDVYQLETSDVVQGGSGGVSNSPNQNLTNRTERIKETLDLIGVDVETQTITNNSVNGEFGKVDTLADLLLYEGSVGETIYLKYRLTIGDGGHGHFMWDTSDLSTEVAVDTLNGIYVCPNGGNGSGGAWVRQFDGLDVSPLWFGLVPDDDTKGVVNYGAIRAALTYCISIIAPKLEGWPVLRFGAGIIYITGDSPLALTRSELEALPGAYRYRRGMSYRGNGRGSTVLVLKSAGTEDLWFYSNYDAAYPGAMSGMDLMTFSDLTFRGTEVNYSQPTGSKTNGFYWESTGWEKQNRFTNCNFEYLDTVFDISGFGNADLNKWVGCRFREIRECIVSIDNNQSVANNFFGCDIGNVHGDAFRIGSTGGGDILWAGGSIVFEPELDSGGTPLVTQRNKALVAWDNSGVTSGTSSGPGNNLFLFQKVRFENYSSSTQLVETIRSDSTAYGNIRVNFDDCDITNLHDYPSGDPSVDMPLVSLGNTADVRFNRCTIEHWGTFTVSKFRGSIKFDDCIYINELPMAVPYDLLSGRCSVTSTEGSIVCRGLKTTKETISGNVANVAAPDFTIGDYTLGSPTALVSGKHVDRGWPQLGALGAANVYLPQGSVIYSLSIYKPAETVAAPIANYGLSVISGDATTTLVPTDSGQEDREISIKTYLANPYVVPASPNNYIKLQAVGGTASQVFADKSGRFMVEYQ